MVDPESITPLKNLDAVDSHRAAAALAVHLRDAGIHWLPVADPANVDRLRDVFVTDAAATPAESSEPPGGRQDDAAGTPAPPPTRSGSDADPGAPTPTPTTRAAVPPDKVPAAVAVPREVGTGTRAAPPSRTGPVSVDATAETYAEAALPLEQRSVALKVLETEISICQACSPLVKSRRNTVFGEGNPAARFVFLGECPRAAEDKAARPFVGPAGELLTRMIQACKLARDDVFLLDTIRCRPPGDRSPDAQEVGNCRHFLTRQLALLQPEYIVCLGNLSAQTLLQSKLSVGRLRGKIHRYHASRVVVTYHPEYLNRNPEAKKAAWQDLQMMLTDAGIALS